MNENTDVSQLNERVSWNNIGWSIKWNIPDIVDDIIDTKKYELESLWFLPWTKVRFIKISWNWTKSPHIFFLNKTPSEWDKLSLSRKKNKDSEMIVKESKTDIINIEINKLWWIKIKTKNNIYYIYKDITINNNKTLTESNKSRVY